MINKLHIKAGVDKNLIVYDRNAKSEIVTTHFLNLMGLSAAFNGILLKEVYLPQDISIDILPSVYGEGCGIYHDICLIQNRELNNYGGSLLDYYIKDIKGNFPQGKTLLVVGLSKQEEVILGAI